MTDHQPYPNVDVSNRMELHRLKKAADRGDQRAKVTLEQAEQQRHTAAWDAVEQARADRREELANRKRPASVADALHQLAEVRKAKAVREEERKRQEAAQNDKKVGL